ncbi:hypothetical protein OY671_008290, partial [Metschnikowia pulcherrima]
MKFKDSCGTGKKAISFSEVPSADATRYAAEDADVTWRLHRSFQPRSSDEGGTRIYQRVDRPSIPVVAMMERNGIRVDRERSAALSAEFAARIAESETVIHAKAGGSFTIGSPKQLGEVSFDRSGYKGGKKGKTGQYSTDQSVSEGSAAQGADIVSNGFGDAAEIEKVRAGSAAQHGVKVSYDGADSSKGEAVRGSVDNAVRQMGRIDISVNNAGIQHTASIEDFPTEKWDAISAS